MRAVSSFLVVVSFAIVVGLVWVLFFLPTRYSIGTLVGDDAGYYFAIARNLCLGHGLSFDRLHETNGFNPLLTVLLIVGDRLLVPGLSIEGCYRMGLLITFLAMLGGGIALIGLVGRVLDREAIGNGPRRLLFAASAAFYIWFVGLKSNYGMDGPLVLMLGIAYLLSVARHGLLAPGARAAVLDGLLLGLLFLARVDSLPFLVAAFGLMAVMVLGGHAGWGRLAGRAAWSVLVVAPYIAWSWARFHTWLPVSARIKTAFPSLDLERSLQVVRHSSLNPADQASFLLGFVIALTTVVIVLARVGYLLAFSRADVQGSYVILVHVYNLLMGLAVTSALARRPGAFGRQAPLAAAAALVLVSAVLLAGKLDRTRAWYEAMRPGGPGDEAALAAAIRDRTGPKDVLYGGAFGLVGFLSDRAWINGDGVANTYAYQQAVHEGRLDAYLAENRVTHVVFSTPHTVPPPSVHRLVVASLLHGGSSTLSLDERNLLLRWPIARGGGMDVCLARWAGPRAQ